ncbi:hypothetical protein D3C86_1567800 [compost metagenome]
MRQQQHVPVGTEGIFKRAKRPRVKGIGDVGKHASDGPAASGAQGAGGMAGLVFQLRHRVLDLRAHIRRDIGCLIEHTRGAAHRNAGHRGDVLNSNLLVLHTGKGAFFFA